MRYLSYYSALVGSFINYLIISPVFVAVLVKLEARSHLEDRTKKGFIILLMPCFSYLKSIATV
jgi:hypothetical protein